MLTICGDAVVKQQYTRIPMTDGIGAVTAILRPSQVMYRPLYGTEESRRVRADLIRAEIGGEVVLFSEYGSNPYVGVVVPFGDVDGEGRPAISMTPNAKTV
jgi:hypothetical protein